MLLFPNCKINIGLDILRRRPDGFHDIETVMYPVMGLCDGLEMIHSDRAGVQFSGSGLAIGCPPGGNLAVRAYGLMRSRYGISGIKMHLHKSIPFGAGLGGGSADAAFTIAGLDKLFNLGLPESELEGLAAELGSDTAFFIRNTPRFCEGRGEAMSPAHVDLNGKFILIIKPRAAVSTAAAYAGVTPAIPGESLRELVGLPMDEWRGKVHNHFEESVFSHYPELAQIKKAVYDAGASYAAMSGSGSAIYGIFVEEPKKLRPTNSIETQFIFKM